MIAHFVNSIRQLRSQSSLSQIELKPATRSSPPLLRHSRPRRGMIGAFDRNYMDGNGQRALPGTFGLGAFNPPGAGYYDSYANFPSNFTTSASI